MTILKRTLITTLAAVPATAFSQSNQGAAVGAVGGAAAGALVGGIAADQRTEFRTYVKEQRVPSVAYREKVIVGATLPDTVTYREVPARYGKTE